MSNLLLATKDIPTIIHEAEHGEGDAHVTLKRSLGLMNLITLGIGAIIGAGIFSLTGQAAGEFAGPGVTYSFMIAGVGCALAGLCYAEFALMIPVAGSAYTYSYATMGELMAWIIGWDLVLEYAVAAATVAISGSGYLNKLIGLMAGHRTGHLLRLRPPPLEAACEEQGVILNFGCFRWGKTESPRKQVSLMAIVENMGDPVFKLSCILFFGSSWNPSSPLLSGNHGYPSIEYSAVP